MSLVRWFEGYNGQTLDQLLVLEGAFRVDSLVAAIDEALRMKDGDIGSPVHGREEAIIMAVEELRREVDNGSYYDFLYNASDETLSIIGSALEEIGCSATALITRRAIDALQLGGTINARNVDAALESEDARRDAQLVACDCAFHGRPDKLEAALFAFIKTNRHHIVLK